MLHASVTDRRRQGQPRLNIEDSLGRNLISRAYADSTQWNLNSHIKGAFVWDQSGIRIIGIMRVRVCLGAIPIPEYLDFHFGYSAPSSRIAGMYSGIYSYSGISQTNAPIYVINSGTRELTLKCKL